MPELTTNLGLKKPLGNEIVSREAYNENLDILDQNVVKKGEGIAELIGGTLADRPDPGIVGRYYFAQDIGEIYLDIGTKWILAAASREELTTLRDDVTTHSADDVKHITQEEREAWNQAESNAKAYVDQKISSGIDADKLDGKQASDFQNGVAIGSSSDPNTTMESYILTNHANSPNSSIYWHIQTYFYSSKTGNRAQIAIPYNGSNDTLFVRHKYGTAWTSWKEIGGGTMFEDMTPKMVKARTTDDNYTTVVNIVGSGYLTSINQYFSEEASSYLRITLDGTVIFDDYIFGSYSNERVTVSVISSLMRFNSSLKVEHKDVDDESGYSGVNTVVSYLLD